MRWAAASAQGSANVDPYRSRDAWNAVHTEGRMSMRVQMDFTAFAERDDNAMLKEYLRNALPTSATTCCGPAASENGRRPRPKSPRRAQRSGSSRRLAGAVTTTPEIWVPLTQLVEQLEDVNKEIDITGLRWNVNLLGSGVGWVTAGLLDRLQSLGCSIQMSANNWVNSTNASMVAGACLPDDQPAPHPQEPVQQRHPHLAAEPVAVTGW